MYHTEEILTHREVDTEGEMEEPDDLQQLHDRKQEDLISTKNNEITNETLGKNNKGSTCSEIDETEKTKEYEIPLQEANIQQDQLFRTSTELDTEQVSQETGEELKNQSMIMYPAEVQCEQVVLVKKVTETKNEVDMATRTDIQQEVKEDKIISDANEDDGKYCSKEKTRNRNISACLTKVEGQHIEPLNKKKERNNKGSDIEENTAIHKEKGLQEKAKVGEVVLHNVVHDQNDVPKKEAKQVEEIKTISLSKVELQSDSLLDSDTLIEENEDAMLLEDGVLLTYVIKTSQKEQGEGK